MPGSCSRGVRDHPRVCGEHPLWLSRSRFGVGSSPRMRGTLCRCCRTRFRLGIIPAYVGNTVRLTFAWPETWDHPRVCGEHTPRIDGGTISRGSSPRMRGTPAGPVPDVRAGGIIPAYAGNTPIASSPVPPTWDHPRVCGEHISSSTFASSTLGSSPRMRGTLVPFVDFSPCRGIIPAYAGNTWPLRMEARLSRDHPRVCGEHSTSSKPPDVVSGSSPRMRGTQTMQIRIQPQGGIIPAYAGNTAPVLTMFMSSRDHPRVCGEHDHHLGVVPVVQGSSPRMRGTLS